MQLHRLPYTKAMRLLSLFPLMHRWGIVVQFVLHSKGTRVLAIKKHNMEFFIAMINHFQDDNHANKHKRRGHYLKRLCNLIRKLPIPAGAVVLAPIVRVVWVGISHTESNLLGVLNLDVDSIPLNG